MSCSFPHNPFHTLRPSSRETRIWQEKTSSNMHQSSLVRSPDHRSDCTSDLDVWLGRRVSESRIEECDSKSASVPPLLYSCWPLYGRSPLDTQKRTIATTTSLQVPRYVSSQHFIWDVECIYWFSFRDWRGQLKLWTVSLSWKRLRTSSSTGSTSSHLPSSLSMRWYPIFYSTMGTLLACFRKHSLRRQEVSLHISTTSYGPPGETRHIWTPSISGLWTHHQIPKSTGRLLRELSRNSVTSLLQSWGNLTSHRRDCR